MGGRMSSGLRDSVLRGSSAFVFFPLFTSPQRNVARTHVSCGRDEQKRNRGRREMSLRLSTLRALSPSFALAVLSLVSAAAFGQAGCPPACDKPLDAGSVLREATREPLRLPPPSEP